MRYELECGHCGYQFVASAVELPRTMKCAVCGGVLAIARPFAIASTPPEPEPPAPPAPPEAPSPVLGGLAPEARARFLAPPWNEVRFALSCARSMINSAAALVAVLAFLTVVAAPLLQPDWWKAQSLPQCLCWAFLLPGIFHAVGQWRCTKVPRTHGRALANESLMTLAFASVGALGWWYPYPASVIFAVAGAAALIVSFAFWLGFLAQLGRALGDDVLASRARASRVRLPFELVLLTVLLVSAIQAARIPSPVLIWIDWTAAGVLGFVALRQYSELLRIAVRAIDTRAPVETDR